MFSMYLQDMGAVHSTHGSPLGWNAPRLGLVMSANKQTGNNAGPGRPKGSPNKTTALLKDAIIKAAEAAGENMNGKGGLVGYCTFLATQEPKAFAQLLGKVLPMQVTGLDGADGEPTAIEMRIVRPRG